MEVQPHLALPSNSLLHLCPPGGSLKVLPSLPTPPTVDKRAPARVSLLLLYVPKKRHPVGVVSSLSVHLTLSTLSVPRPPIKVSQGSGQIRALMAAVGLVLT